MNDLKKLKPSSILNVESWDIVVVNLVHNRFWVSSSSSSSPSSITISSSNWDEDFAVVVGFIFLNIVDASLMFEDLCQN